MLTLGNPLKGPQALWNPALCRCNSILLYPVSKQKAAAIFKPAAVFRLSKTPGGIGGPQPSDYQTVSGDMYCGPNPTFGRVWASALRSASRCPRASVRFAHPSGRNGTLAQQGIPIAVCHPASRRLLGKRCNFVKKAAAGVFFDELKLLPFSNRQQFFVVLLTFSRIRHPWGRHFPLFVIGFSL